MLTLINPVPRAEPFDHGDWLFELKYDGFRAAADTVRGRLISRNGSRMRRFEEVLDRLPKGHVFDGELVVLDDAGRPLFNELLFGRRRPTYVALAEFVGMREQIQQT
jgi:ATP-dependent DNA ligase